MALPKNFNGVSFTKRITKVLHNREVKKYFRDVQSDTSRANGRQALKTALLIKDEDSLLEVINKQLVFRFGLAESNLKIDTTPVIPEWWAVRKGADRPQLVLVFQIKRPTKSPTTRYSLVIPHYNNFGKIRTSPIGTYQKGSIRGCLTLKDNSKVIVYTKTEQEAKRVLNQAKKVIIPRFLEDSKITFGKKKGRELNDPQVVPLAAKYFPKGQQDLIPQWRVDF